MKRYSRLNVVLLVIVVYLCTPGLGLSEVSKENIYDPGKLKPVDSILKVKVMNSLHQMKFLLDENVTHGLLKISR